MHRLFGILLFFLYLIRGPLAWSQVAGGKPNIIIIYADDLGYGELGCYGQQKIKTPHLDKMAQEGMLFTQHYSGAPVCAPSRCMLLTGRHSGHSFIRGNYEFGGFPDSTEGGQMPIPEGIITLPKMLQQAGYATGMFGKWGLGMNNTSGSPNKQGFDDYFGYLDQKQAHNYYPTHLWSNDAIYPLQNEFITVHRPLDSASAKESDFKYFIGKEYAPDVIMEKAMNFIHANQTKPFFLYLPFTLPHVSLQVPQKYIEPYLGEFKEQPYFGNKGYASALYPNSTYAGMISYLDEQVGRVLSVLQALGLDEQTLIFFSSDNGPTFAGGADANCFNSTGGLRGWKMDLFEGGIRVPFIARWPGKIQPNTKSNLVCTQYDYFETIAELLNLKAPKSDGISMLPTLFGKHAGQSQHQQLYFEYPENGGQLAIRIGNWKGVKLNVRNDKNSPWMLFDLASDLNERHDLAAKYPEVIRQLDEIVSLEHQCPTIREWEFIDPKFKVAK